MKNLKHMIGFGLHFSTGNLDYYSFEINFQWNQCFYFFFFPQQIRVFPNSRQKYLIFSDTNMSFWKFKIFSGSVQCFAKIFCIRQWSCSIVFNQVDVWDSCHKKVENKSKEVKKNSFFAQCLIFFFCHVKMITVGISDQ